MMDVRPFCVSTDLDWYSRISGAAIPSHILPANGFVVDNVGAVFIYLTDSSMALIDGLALDKSTSLRTRYRALVALIQACTKFGHDNNLFCAITTNKIPALKMMTKHTNMQSLGDNFSYYVWTNGSYHSK